MTRFRKRRSREGKKPTKKEIDRVYDIMYNAKEYSFNTYYNAKKKWSDWLVAGYLDKHVGQHEYQKRLPACPLPKRGKGKVQRKSSSSRKKGWIIEQIDDLNYLIQQNKVAIERFKAGLKNPVFKAQYPRIKENIRKKEELNKKFIKDLKNLTTKQKSKKRRSKSKKRRSKSKKRRSKSKKRRSKSKKRRSKSKKRRSKSKKRRSKSKKRRSKSKKRRSKSKKRRSKSKKRRSKSKKRRSRVI